MKGGVVFELAAHFLHVESRVVDVARVDFRQEFRKANFFFFLGVAAGPHDLPEQEGRNHDDRPEKYRLNRRIHSELLKYSPVPYQANESTDTASADL